MAKGKPGISWHFLIAAVAAFIVCILVLVFFGDKIWPGLWQEKPVKPVHTETADLPKPASEPVTQPAAKELDINIYFVGKGGEKLVAERRHIKAGSLQENIKTALTTLLSGSKQGNYSPIPQGTRLISVTVSNGTAKANFSSELVRNHPGGSSAELSTVYSIVNTVALNFHDIKHVLILVDGEPRDTIAGHLLISTPLKPNIKLIGG